MLENVFVADALRTPIGRYGGVLSGVRPDDLLAGVLRALVDRNPGMDPAAIEDVIIGAANQSGEDNRNVARMSALLAGLPETVAGVTVNRLCASGLQAIMDTSRAISCGEGEVYLAGGVESMSRAPYVIGKSDQAFGRGQQMFDTTMGWRFINPALAEVYHPYTMGETAENVAKRWNITREEQDAFALQSQLRYVDAKAAGKWEEEIVAVEITNQRREVSWITEDEHPRLTSLEALARLKPAFIKDGTVTAGNSSGINDGAAALLLAGKNSLERYGLQPMAKVVAMGVAGVDPAIMGMGPVPAVRKALKRAGLTLEDIGLVELNEAFAAQSIACIRDLELDPALVNVNGGAIALGHPLGCSGARISTTLLYEMQRRGVRYGIATMCIGVGQGAAIIYQNIM
jgi:acetyl-CoA C-acetyltransferase